MVDKASGMSILLFKLLVDKGVIEFRVVDKTKLSSLTAMSHATWRSEDRAAPMLPDTAVSNNKEHRSCLSLTHQLLLLRSVPVCFLVSPYNRTRDFNVRAPLYRVQAQSAVPALFSCVGTSGRCAGIPITRRTVFHLALSRAWKELKTCLLPTLGGHPLDDGGGVMSSANQTSHDSARASTLATICQERAYVLFLQHSRATWLDSHLPDKKRVNI